MSRRLRLLAVVAAVIALSACSGAAQPDALRQGRTIYGDMCSVCHGNRGQGGVGPSLDNVIDTWPSCDDQIHWVELGTEGWKLEMGDTYGAMNTPITGVMPGHADRLSRAEIAAVAAFERITYGGADSSETLDACGITQ